MSSIRRLLFLPGEDCQYMTHKLVIIQKSLQTVLCLCHRKVQGNQDAGNCVGHTSFCSILMMLIYFVKAYRL